MRAVNIMHRRMLRANRMRSNMAASCHLSCSNMSTCEGKMVFPGTSREQVYSNSIQESFVHPEDRDVLPIFRVMDEAGEVIEGSEMALMGDKDKLYEMYRVCVRLQEMDRIMYESQRQGRIAFYAVNSGEEAIHIGSAAALDDTDTIFAQYREAGVLLWRGFTVEDCADQLLGNSEDTGKGRQLPVHYGSRKLHFQTISSPLGTRIPQAAGAAYSLKITTGNHNIVACYFGDGAASEGDFAPGLNFAATLEAPVVFICRNNGYAISTPVKDQFSERADGIGQRGLGYGITTVRVDGNDVFAVYETVKAARAYALTHSRPVLVEAMTYRQGHHSTSDDSTAYREVSEMQMWKEQFCPVKRFRHFLERTDFGWSAEQEAKLRGQEADDVFQALLRSEKKPICDVGEMFTDVYKQAPQHIQQQAESLRSHLSKYPGAYDLEH